MCHCGSGAAHAPRAQNGGGGAEAKPQNGGRGKKRVPDPLKHPEITPKSKHIPDKFTRKSRFCVKIGRSGVNFPPRCMRAASGRGALFGPRPIRDGFSSNNPEKHPKFAVWS